MSYLKNILSRPYTLMFDEKALFRAKILLLLELSYVLLMFYCCLLYTSPSPRDGLLSRMPSSA